MSLIFEGKGEIHGRALIDWGPAWYHLAKIFMDIDIYLRSSLGHQKISSLLSKTLFLTWLFIIQLKRIIQLLSLTYLMYKIF